MAVCIRCIAMEWSIGEGRWVSHGRRRQCLAVKYIREVWKKDDGDEEEPLSHQCALRAVAVKVDFTTVRKQAGGYNQVA